MTSTFLELIRAGYELIPLTSRNTPYKSWLTDPPLSESEAGVLKHVGIRLRATDLIIDVDMHPGKANGEESAARLMIQLGEGLVLSSYPTVLTPSGGRHVLMTKPADLEAEIHLPDFKGIDFLSVGHYIVAVGSDYKLPGHPRYEWDLASPDLPTRQAPDELLAMLRVKERVSYEGEPEWTPEMLSEYLSKLDPEVVAGTNAGWLQIASACHEVTRGAGEEEFIAWSLRDPLYADSAEINRARWRSFTAGKPGAAGAGTLRSIALRNGISQLPAGRAASADFEGVEEESPSPPSDDEPEQLGPLEKLTKDYKVVAEGGKVYVMTAQRSDEHGHDQWEWYAPEQFLKLTKSVLKLGEVAVEAGDKVRFVPAGQHWLDTHRKKKTFVGTALEPGQGERTRDGRLNLWRGFAVEAKEGDWSLLRNHIHEVLSDRDAESSEYILRWLARCVQRPDEPGEVALVMQGGMGVGKGILGSALARLFGPHGAEIRSREHLTGRFNYHLRDKCVLFADEAVWSGNKEAESVLKGMITEKNLAYERKGADIVWGRNRLHIIMASNEEWVAPVAWDDRRYAIFRTRQAKRDRAYFDKMFKQLESGGYGAMLWDLQRMDLSSFHVLDDRPNTVALREQKRQSMSSVERWILSIMETGELEEMAFDRAGSQYIFKHDLQASYVSYLSSEGVKGDGYVGISERLGRTLVKMFPGTTSTRISNDDGEQKRAYAFPNLHDDVLSAIKNAG